MSRLYRGEKRNALFGRKPNGNTRPGEVPRIGQMRPRYVSTGRLRPRPQRRPKTESDVRAFEAAKAKRARRAARNLAIAGAHP